MAGDKVYLLLYEHIDHSSDVVCVTRDIVTAKRKAETEVHSRLLWLTYEDDESHVLPLHRSIGHSYWIQELQVI